MASPLRHCALRLPSEAPDTTIDTHCAYIRGTVECVTFPTGGITGLQSADFIEMIEIQDGGGKIETRVRESCCTVATLTRGTRQTTRHTFYTIPQGLETVVRRRQDRDSEQRTRPTRRDIGYKHRRLYTPYFISKTQLADKKKSARGERRDAEQLNATPDRGHGRAQGPGPHLRYSRRVAPIV